MLQDTPNRSLKHLLTNMVATSRRPSYQTPRRWSSLTTTNVSPVPDVPTLVLTQCAAPRVKAQIRKGVSVIKPQWIFESIKRHRPIPLLKELGRFWMSPAPLTEDSLRSPPTTIKGGATTTRR